MATSRPFAYNTGSTILGTTQIGSLSVGIPTSGFTGNPKWWNGPDEDLGYVICRPNTNGNQPNPGGLPAFIRFSRSKLKTDQSFINLVNSVFKQTFTTTTECTSYLTTNNYWTSFVGGGGGFVPGDFTFTDGTVLYTTNTVTFTKTGTICLEGVWVSGLYVIKITGGYNTSPDVWNINWYQTAAEALLYKQTQSYLNRSGSLSKNNPGGESFIYAVIDVTIGSTLKFELSRTDLPPQNAASGVLNIYNSSFSGTLVDTITVTQVSACYLTTTMVQYKGLLDDGPELTAMRQLREHYRGDEYYENGLIEYYTNSEAIINGINASEDPSIDYEFIYQSVLKVKNYVDQSMWKEAIDEYIDTYFILKNRYI
jgi:hypothetical protein